MLTRVNSDDQFTICTNLVLCTCMAVISQKKESDLHTESLINTFRLDRVLDAGSRSRSTLTRRGRGRRGGGGEGGPLLSVFSCHACERVSQLRMGTRTEATSQVCLDSTVRPGQLQTLL